MASYLTAVKQELDRLLEEKVEVRNFAKAFGQDQSSQLVVRLNTFEEFQERVLSTLELWEQKALEISDLSAKYYSELEENKKIFLALKQILKDKDQLISHLKK